MKFDEHSRFEISKEELVQLFSAAFTKMLDRDSDLFESQNQVQERTFMHRLAFYLHELLRFPEEYVGINGIKLSLDVEYNRDGDDVKRLSRVPKKDWVAPDIILHERKSGALNGEERYRNDIFVCEIKKNGDADGDDAARVKAYMEEKKYEYGINLYRLTSRPYGLDLYVGNNQNPERYLYDEQSSSFIKADVPKRERI